MKNIAIVLVILLLCLLAFVLFHSSNVAVIVNGHRLIGPAKVAAEGWGVLVAVVSLFCTAILLIFAVAGTGLVFLGMLVFAGLVTVCFVFPFMLPLLIPLFLVWIFVAAIRRSGKLGT